MTDPFQPDHFEDPQPERDNQAEQGSGGCSEEGVDTAAELPVVAPDSVADSDLFATMPATVQERQEVVLKKDFVPGYDLLGELGRGGMGVVYQARDQKLKRLVAVKMILGGVHASQEDMQRFQTEAEAVAKLQHPNIVQIFEVGEYQGNPYISLEYQQGGGLDQKIAGTPQNIEESAELIETVSLAMHVAHQQEIIHRDLKPANILLSSEGEPKITDFGLAKRMDDDSNQTKTGAVMGTPSYMPPEQASSSIETLGPAADTYALGAILYHLLTGRPPFKAETHLDTLMQVINDDPVPPRRLNSNVPVDLETICLKCLQKDIKRRYATAAALAEDLRRFRGGEPIAGRPVSTIERGWKWARRRPAIAGMISVSIVAAVALVVGGLWYNARLVEERNVAQWQRRLAESRESEARLAQSNEAAQRKLAETREAEARLAQANEAQQRKLAEEQKEAADRNFKLARDAVDELTTISQGELFNLPRMEPVRRELLQKARAFYETFVTQETDDPKLLVELGDAHLRLGNIHRKLGDIPAAKSEHEKAITVYSQLVKNHNDVPLYALDLANSYNNLALVNRTGGHAEKAIELYSKSILIKKQLVKDHPEVAKYADDLARSYNNQALAQTDLGQTDKAIELTNKAIPIREQLVRQHPDVPKYALGLANSYNNQALAQMACGQAEKAIAFFDKAILIQTNFPDVPGTGLDLANSYNNLALAQSVLGQTGKAIELYSKSVLIKEQLVKDHPDVPKYVLSLVNSYNNLALAQMASGQTDQAMELTNKTILIKEELVKDYPDVPKYASVLADSYYNLAAAQMAHAQQDQAVELINKAILIQKQLVKDHPDVPGYASKLIASCHNLAVALSDLGQTNEAIELYRNGIDLAEQLVKDHPNVPSYALGLAASYNNLALEERTRGQMEQAVQFINRSILIQEQLVKDHPDLPRCAAELARSYKNMAVTKRVLRQTDEVIEFANKAIVIREQLIKDHPSVREYAADLAGSYHSLAVTHKALGQTEEAIELYNKSILIKEQLVKDHPNTPKYTADLARTYYSLVGAQMAGGKTDHVGAAEMGEKLVQLEFPDDQSVQRSRHLYNAACLLSLALGAAVRDEDLTEADRMTLVEKYAVRSMELLTEARNAGWFQRARNIAHAKATDTDLDPLRNRADFKQFLKDLESDKK